MPTPLIVLLILMLMPATDLAAQQSTPQRAGNGESRETPYAAGQSGEVGDYELRVVDITADATDAVLAENAFNEPPETGRVFFIARVEATYRGWGSGRPGSDLRFSVVGHENQGVTEGQAPCGVIPDEAREGPEVFEGGSAELNVCWSVPKDEVGSLVMYVEPSFSFDEERVWFSLDVPSEDAGTPAS